MLTLYDHSGNPGGRTRREFLQVGTAAIGGLTLSSLFATRAAATALGRSVVRDRSVVVLNLQGGPTQFETFDPKMDAPSEIRSITGEVQTTLPGVTFGGSFPKLARWAHKMAIVRSYRHGISSHGPAAMHVMAGGNPTGVFGRKRSYCLCPLLGQLSFSAELVEPGSKVQSENQGMRVLQRLG